MSLCIKTSKPPIDTIIDHVISLSLIINRVILGQSKPLILSHVHIELTGHVKDYHFYSKAETFQFLNPIQKNKKQNKIKVHQIQKSSSTR